MSGSSYWDSGPGDPGRPVLKFIKIKPPAMQVLPIPCTLCKKPFYQYVHLQQHSRCHSGKRPFRCHACNRSFLQLSHLMKHRFVKHETRKKCGRCGSMYSRWSAFLHHTIQTHGVRTLTLPKHKKTVKKVEVENPPKLSIKLCIKKSSLNVMEDTESAGWTVKKRKKHKKHKKEMKRQKKMQLNALNKSDMEVQSVDSKSRIILKFRMPKDSSEQGQSESSRSTNNGALSSSEPKTPAAAASTKTEAFTELVQSPSPKDSGIDDCSPLHETDHNENCSSNSAGVKSVDGTRQRKELLTPAVTPVTSAASSPFASSPAAASSLSVTPTSSSSAATLSPRRPTRQDAVLRSLMSVTPNSSAPSTPDNRKAAAAESCVIHKVRSSHAIKQEACNSPLDVTATASPYISMESDYVVPQSPVPSLKLTISKKTCGKLRGSKNSYTSLLHLTSDFVPPASPSERMASKSPRSLSASPRAGKRHHSPFKASRSDPCDSARLLYSPDATMPRSPWQAKSPKLYRMESSDTVYSTSHQSSLSPPHSLKSERDFGALNVDIDGDPYAFDDDPCNSSPHLRPYSSTLPRRSDKYKLDPPVLEPQTLPSLAEPNDVKHKSRPRLTKQVDLKKQKMQKSPARSLSKDAKSPRAPRARKHSKTKLLSFIKQEVMEETTTPFDLSMPTLTHNLPTMTGSELVLNANSAMDMGNEEVLEHRDCGSIVCVANKLSACACDGDMNKNSIAEPVLQGSHTRSPGGDADMSIQTTLPPLLPNETGTTQCKENSARLNIGMAPMIDTTQFPSEHVIEEKAVPFPDFKIMKTKHSDLVPTCNDGEEEHPQVAEHASDMPSLADVVGVLSSVSSIGHSTAPAAVQQPSPHDPTSMVAIALTTSSPIKQASASVAPMDIPPMDDVNVGFDDSDLMLSDPVLENLSFNDSFLELGNDVTQDATGEALFDDLRDSTSTIRALETASKASAMETSKRKAESDPIVVTLPAEAGMEPISLVIGNEDSDHFGESDDDVFDLTSLSSAPLVTVGDAVLSMSGSHSSASMTNSTAAVPLPTMSAVVDMVSELGDLQSAGSPVGRVASKPVTGFFNAFASFVGAVQPASAKRQSPGYSSEFAKFLSQKSVASDEGSVSSGAAINSNGDGKQYTRAEIRALEHSHLCVQRLSEQVWVLLRALFPHMELPVYMSGSSPCGVETLVDRVIRIVTTSNNEQDNNNSGCAQTKTCCEPSISLCARPEHCLARLRTKVCNLLGTILPQLSLSPAFSQTGEEVDKLVACVIDANVT